VSYTFGMDTPERDDICGPNATTKNRELVNWQYIVMVKDVSETERYERLLRYVFVDNIFVNYEHVIQGYANAATYPPDVACESIFVEAERCKAGRSQLLKANANNSTDFAASATNPTSTATTDTTAKQQLRSILSDSVYSTISTRFRLRTNSIQKIPGSCARSSSV
jgi:hypothetical protein